MRYIKLDGMDGPVSIFAVALAHMQLEADYNVGGILRERPSNVRRNASTGCQLARMKFEPGFWWVHIEESEDCGDSDAEAVKDIYMRNVLKWGLPVDKELAAVIRARYTPEFLSQYNF